MSEQPQENQVYIAESDLDHIEKFFSHFKLEMPDYLVKAYAEHRARKSFESQEEARFATAKAFTQLKGHSPIFDEVFQVIFDSTNEISFEEQFQRDLESVIGQNPEDQTSQEASEPSDSSPES